MRSLNNEVIFGNSWLSLSYAREAIYQFLHSIGITFSGAIQETASRPFRFAGRDSKEKTEWMHCKYLEKGILITAGSFHPTLPQKVIRFFPYRFKNKTEKQELHELKKARIEHASYLRKAEEKQKSKARENALKIYQKASANGVAYHPYFIRKQLCYPYDLRLIDYQIQGHVTSSLVIPIRDFSNSLQAIQLIFANAIDFGNGKPRNKHFIGSIKGNFFLLGQIVDRHRYLLCEGIATGCSLFQSSFYTTLCCLSCKNYYSVIKGLISQYPKANILIACDNDVETIGNPGIKEAQKMQQMFSNIRLIIPPSKSGNSTDFNDLYCRGIT